VVWDAAGVNEIRNNSYFEEYDQTADCVNSPKVGDKLGVNYTVTTLPNSGVFAYDDCDGPGPNVNEEVEVALNSNSVVAGTNYQYDIIWICNGTNISGEVNVTFEYSNIYRDHNTNTQYWGWCGGSARVANPGSGSAPENWNGNQLTSPKHVTIHDTGQAENGLRYEVLRTSSGRLRARSRADFSSSSEFQDYRQFNTELLASLKGKMDSPILAVVTMREAISADDLAVIADQADLQIISYGILGANSDGQQVSVYVWPTETQGLIFPTEENIRYQGIYTFVALVRLTTIDTLLLDPNVVLVDVSANQIRDEILAKLGEPIDVTQIGIPNPAWYFMSGELTLP
jgi:hypothetical protein